MTPQHIAVIDIGKTNAKLALVDLDRRTEIAVRTRPNLVLQAPPYPHMDTAGIWTFLLTALRDFHAEHRIDAISITTHGACAALLDARGSLAAPILDYEHPGPDSMRDAYEALRPDFAETGSARLPGGLNIGAQLFWQFQTDPDLLARTAQLVTYPQYWGHRLTGQLATDVTSLGCHTDLWNPYTGQFSTLVDRLGLTGRIAPPRRPSDLLGTLRPEIASQTGLPASTPVATGIHDSNASLLPHLLSRQVPFSVVSTGTWVVVMAVGGHLMPLDPARDTLVNVNALGQPVPSARFMGGREYEIIRQNRAPVATTADRVLQQGLMLLPAVQRGSGPYPNHTHQWQPAPPTDWADTETALSLYLALMTAECLSMIGAAGPVLIEGPFARNGFYADMLGAATGRPVLTSASQTGTAIGAALLFATGQIPPETTARPAPDPALQTYATHWRSAVQSSR